MNKILKDNEDGLLKAIRLAMGLNITKLAALADVEYSSVFRLEKGLVIGSDRVYKIARALEISPDILFYSIGQIPKDKIELIKKDPLGFKKTIDEACSEPWRLTKTKDYVESVRKKVEETNPSPEIKKILSQIKPTEGD
jgi:transcriptional regulator with XRE-family HTH domain